jgi:hypothetical protein
VVFQHDLRWAFPVAIVLCLFGLWLIGVIERLRERGEAPSPTLARSSAAEVTSFLARAVRGATGPIGDVLTTISGTDVKGAAKIDFPGLDVKAKGVVTHPEGPRGPTGPKGT